LFSSLSLSHMHDSGRPSSHDAVSPDQGGGKSRPRAKEMAPDTGPLAEIERASSVAHASTVWSRYGDAAFYGSTGSIHLNQPIVGISAP
jgi:hypothetical protein